MTKVISIVLILIRPIYGWDMAVNLVAIPLLMQINRQGCDPEIMQFIGVDVIFIHGVSEGLT
jgi:hypothetical protein